MKRITVIMVLSLILSMIIGCNGGGGGSEQVKVTISPKDVTLFLGEEKTFTAVVSGASDQRVTWAATGGEIDDDGLYLATELGTFEVKATSKADPSKTATTTVNVLPQMGDFPDVMAWVGTVNWNVSGSWSSSGEGDTTYDHKINEDITREYRLEDKRYDALLQRDVWRRHLDSAVVVRGAIKDRSDESPGDYCEINWSGQITVVPDTRDYLSIDKSAGTYSIYLYAFDASPIPCTIYESGEPWETWNDFRLDNIQITNQRLPLTGTTLAGSKVEKRFFSPLWGGAGALDPKELDVTITWSFVPDK